MAHNWIFIPIKSRTYTYVYGYCFKQDMMSTVGLELRYIRVVHDSAQRIFVAQLWTHIAPPRQPYELRFSESAWRDPYAASLYWYSHWQANNSSVIVHQGHLILHLILIS